MLVALVLALSVPAQAPFELRTGRVAGHPEWEFWDLTVDLGRAALQLVDKKGGAPLETMVTDGAWAALNGGYWKSDYRPTGWTRDAARELSRRRKSGGGVGIVAVKGARVYVGRVAQLEFDPEFAIQNSPLLIEADGTLGIRRDDGRRAARTVACLEGQTLRFIVIEGGLKSGPTLMETARLLQAPRDQGGFGCSAALNLDGGPSSGVWFSPRLKARASLPAVPIGYGIVIRAVGDR